MRPIAGLRRGYAPTLAMAEPERSPIMKLDLAVRTYVLQKRGAIAHDIRRFPTGSLTAKSSAEIDYLLSRLARLDLRAGFHREIGA